MTAKAFETDRLFLKPTSQEDAELILKLLNTPKWIENIGDRNVHDIEEAKKYIAEKMTPQLERLGYSNYTIIRKTDGIKMGICGLYDRDGLEEVDIGFALLTAYERKGYALEAASRIRDAGFEEFGLETIIAITTKGNTSSQTLLEKLGLKPDGQTTLPNGTEELLVYKRENGSGS